MKTLGIIPARAGSKRVHAKNRRVLGGRTLVNWVFDAARSANKLSSLVVSSDDPIILEWVRSRDQMAALARPTELAADDSPAIDYVRHALQAVESRGGGQFEAVAIIQPSSPLTQARDIDATIDLLETSGAISAVSVVRLEHAVHPLKLKLMQDDRLIPYLEEERGRLAEHELVSVFIRNGSVYATRREALDRGIIIGDDCRGYVMPRERSIDINDDLDLRFAEFLLAEA